MSLSKVSNLETALNQITLLNVTWQDVETFLESAISFFGGGKILREHVNEGSKTPFSDVVKRLLARELKDFFEAEIEVPRDPVYGKFDTTKKAPYLDVVITPTDLILDVMQLLYDKNPDLIKNLNDKQIQKIRWLTRAKCYMALGDHSFNFYQTIRVHALKRGIPFFEELEKEAVTRGLQDAGFSMEDCANMNAPYQKNFRNIFLTAVGQNTRVEDNPVHIPDTANIDKIAAYLDTEAQAALKFIRSWNNADPNYFNKNITLPNGTVINFFEIQNSLPLILLVERNLNETDRALFNERLNNAALDYIKTTHPEEYEALDLGGNKTGKYTVTNLSASIGIEVETTKPAESALTYVLGTMFGVNFDADASVTDRDDPTAPQREYTSGIIRTELDLKRFLFFVELSAKAVNKSCAIHVHFGSLPFLKVQAQEFELAILERQRHLPGIEEEYQTKLASVGTLKAEVLGKRSESMCLGSIARPLDYDTAAKAELTFLKALIFSYAQIEPHLRGFMRDGALWNDEAMWAKAIALENGETGDTKTAGILGAKNYEGVWSIINAGNTQPTRRTRTHTLNIESLPRHSTVEDRIHDGSTDPATIEAFARIHLRMVSMIQERFRENFQAITKAGAVLDESAIKKLAITAEEASTLMILYFAERTPPSDDQKQTTEQKTREQDIYKSCKDVVAFVTEPVGFSSALTVDKFPAIIAPANIDSTTLRTLLKLVSEDYPVGKGSPAGILRENLAKSLEESTKRELPAAGYGHKPAPQDNHRAAYVAIR